MQRALQPNQTTYNVQRIPYAYYLIRTSSAQICAIQFGFALDKNGEQIVYAIGITSNT